MNENKSSVKANKKKKRKRKKKEPIKSTLQNKQTNKQKNPQNYQNLMLIVKISASSLITSSFLVTCKKLKLSYKILKWQKFECDGKI